MGAALTLLVVALALGALAAVGITGWEYSNSDAFCTNACHNVHPEEPRAHAASFHARVQCVECHMGRLSTLHLIALKPLHARELWGMIVGYERPVMAHTLRPARESCEACHWPEARHVDSVAVKYRYADDPRNSESRIALQLHTGTGEGRASGSKGTTLQLGAYANPPVGGIHWHIARDVRYVALDPQRQKIAMVEVHDADGKVAATYFDPTLGVSRDEVARLPMRRIDCIDCHNASGHPFGNPARLVDDSLQQGRIDRGLRGIKARSDAIIARASGIAGPEAEREGRFREIIAQAAPKGADPKSSEAERAFAAEMLRILMLSSFDGRYAGQPITWKTFPNNVGHKDFPGCFRCHDGKHLSDQGAPIRLQCTLCHTIPAVVREDGARSVASTVAPDLAPPDFHQEPNFMREHRSMAGESCAACHGPIQFGKDGGSFCANPACHGTKWPQMNLDVQPAGARAAAPRAPKRSS